MLFAVIEPRALGQLPAFNSLHSSFEKDFVGFVASPDHQAAVWKIQTFHGRIGAALEQVRVTSWQRWTVMAGACLPVDEGTELICMGGLNRDAWASGDVIRYSPHLEVRTVASRNTHAISCAVRYDGFASQDQRQQRQELSGQITARLSREGDGFELGLRWIAQSMMPALEWQKKLSSTWQFGLFYQLRPVQVGWRLTKSMDDFLGSSSFSFASRRAQMILGRLCHRLRIWVSWRSLRG